MKKTFTINISGTVFHIEEDAYEKLQSYLLKLKQHFGSTDEGKEIIADIEARIAELFNEKSSDEKKVVVTEWVDEIIETMGTPEDFMEEEGEEEAPAGRGAKRKRRLYRDPDHRVLGGVCGGLGAYFNMDPVILRIIMVVLFLLNGIGLLAYLVLWIAVPKARNTAQRLEMRGKEVTVSNIESSIREEVKEVKESVKKFKESKSYSKGKEHVSEFGDVVYSILKVALKVVVIIIGVILIFSGFFGLLGMVSTMIVGHSIVSNVPMIWSPELHVPGFLNHFVTPGSVTIGMVSIMLLLGIPLLAMLFIGTKLVFRYKTNNTAIALSMVGIWLISLVTIVVVSASQIGNFKDKTSLASSETIQCDNCQTMYLELAEDKWDEYSELDFDIDKFKVAVSDGDEVLLGKPKLDVREASGDNFVVVVRKSSRGSSQSDAKNNIEEIIYNFQKSDSTLTFDPYFIIDEDGKWRDQEVQVTVKVPVGKTIFLDEEMIRIIYDIENVSNTWDGDMVDKYWTMMPEGLTLKEANN